MLQYAGPRYLSAKWVGPVVSHSFFALAPKGPQRLVLLQAIAQATLAGAPKAPPGLRMPARRAPETPAKCALEPCPEATVQPRRAPRRRHQAADVAVGLRAIFASQDDEQNPPVDAANSSAPTIRRAHAPSDAEHLGSSSRLPACVVSTLRNVGCVSRGRPSSPADRTSRDHQRHQRKRASRQRM
ncbi:hypothetical protein ACCO45_004166 [Purpureocillium lilacinum]|uniref:Uncharacterized protein n=1 Tax=Purpureocillium lilacinum TaxID=33203 RepID=A0ACC4E334_PURLI